MYFIEIYFKIIPNFKNLQLLNSFWSQHDIKVLIFVPESFQMNYQMSSIYFITFENQKSLISKVSSIDSSKILAIHSFDERAMKDFLGIKRLLGLEVSEKYGLFCDKYLQKNQLKEIDATFYDLIQNKSIPFSINKKIFPLVIKPIHSWGSRYVMKINSAKELEDYLCDKDYWKYVLEEFLEWEKYSIDYYTNVAWEISWTYPFRVMSGYDIDIPDFFEFAIWTVDSSFDNDLFVKLQKYIQQIVVHLSLRETFVHHEFFLKDNEFKTIELNGRIWWFRPELYLEAYGLNLYNLIHGNVLGVVKKQVCHIFLYPICTWILKWWNEDMKYKIELLESFNSLCIWPWSLEKRQGLSKHGYEHCWYIQLSHSSSNILKSDLNFIQENYFSLLSLQ